MLIDNQEYRSIWCDASRGTVCIIDQTQLPFRFEISELKTLDDVCEAISVMRVRGAPLIGVTAAYGLYLAMRENSGDESVKQAREKLLATRPTAINLRWAIDQLLSQLLPVPGDERVDLAFKLAAELADQDVSVNSRIGEHGLATLGKVSAKNPGETLNIMTHCNAGALATVDIGTALAPVYAARQQGIPIHIWVSETRPRNQGASLTAWELDQADIDHTLIVDNAAGHLMQLGMVDLCIVGADRIAANGDVCNKIGTYQKALAAQDNNVPFYVCAPISTFDWQTLDGAAIPVEERSPDEVTHWSGQRSDGVCLQIPLANETSQAVNPGFDITPARLVSALITEFGLFEASCESLRALRDVEDAD